MKTMVEKLMIECDRRDIVLEHGGEKLLVTPIDRTPPELMEQLRRYKLEILAVLEARKRDAVEHLFRQIVLGEFDGCNDSTREALAAAVQSLPRPLLRSALGKLYER